LAVVEACFEYNQILARGGPQTGHERLNFRRLIQMVEDEGEHAGLRCCRRFEVVLPVMAKDSRQKAFPATVLNISGGGLFCVSAEGRPLGTVLTLRFGDTVVGGNVSYLFTGKVVRCDRSGTRNLLGVEFLGAPLSVHRKDSAEVSLAS
jgi:hypothetical protein